MTASHVLAVAATRTGRALDAVLSAEQLGRAADQAVAALAGLTSTDDATRDTIQAAFSQLNRSASHDPLPWPAEAWYRQHVQTIQATATRCGFSAEPWVKDVRHATWTLP